MSNFKRGIANPDFIAALNKEYNAGGWWRQIVDDKELFIAIRNEYINVYYKGNSLLKLSFNGQLVAETHYKYLVRPDANPCLVKTSSGMGFTHDANQFAIRNLDEINSIKKASAAYSGIEKESIQKIIQSNDNIIDLEIALTNEALKDEMEPDEGKKRSTAKRIDFAALQKKDDFYEVVFFEAKHFSNKELRAKGNDDPSVINQISLYEKLLNTFKEDIIQSYSKVCRNLREILPYSQSTQAIINISEDSPLKINLKPRLVIFGFDEDQKQGKVWQPHKDKLKKILGKEFVLLRGNSNGLNNGIAGAKLSI